MLVSAVSLFFLTPLVPLPLLSLQVTWRESKLTSQQSSFNNFIVSQQSTLNNLISALPGLMSQSITDSVSERCVSTPPVIKKLKVPSWSDDQQPSAYLANMSKFLLLTVNPRLNGLTFCLSISPVHYRPRFRPTSLPIYWIPMTRSRKSSWKQWAILLVKPLESGGRLSESLMSLTIPFTRR